MALQRFIAVAVLLVPCFICVSTRNFPTSKSKLEGLTPCMGDDECNDLKNATCSGGFCVCENDMYVCETASYVVANKMGGKCEESRNCNLNNSVCSSEKKCVCKEGFVASGDRRKCLEVTSVLVDPCEEDIQCSTKIPYSICQNGKCSCQNQTHEHRGFCLRSSALGEECYQSEECMPTSSSCINSRCTCLGTYVAVNGKCLRIAQDMGDGCEEDIQCTTTFGDGSHCSQDICQCRDLYQFKAINSTCVRDIFLDEICVKNTDCHRPGRESSRLRCLQGVCKCKVEYHELDGFCSESSAAATSRQDLFLFNLCLVFFMVFHFCFSIAC